MPGDPLENGTSPAKIGGKLGKDPLEGSKPSKKAKKGGDGEVAVKTAKTTAKAPKAPRAKKSRRPKKLTKEEKKKKKLKEKAKLKMRLKGAAFNLEDDELDRELRRALGVEDQPFNEPL